MSVSDPPRPIKEESAPVGQLWDDLVNIFETSVQSRQSTTMHHCRLDFAVGWWHHRRLTMIEPLDISRKRLRFRAWHRGTKELDLLVGRFADEHLAGFAADELRQFEALLEIPEPLLYDWLLGRGTPPPEARTAVLERLIATTDGTP